MNVCKAFNRVVGEIISKGQIVVKILRVMFSCKLEINVELPQVFNFLVSAAQITVEPRYNDPRYNDIPAKVTAKCMGQNPDITIFDITIFPI